MKMSYYPEGNMSMQGIHQRLDIFVDAIDKKEIWRLGGSERELDRDFYEKIQPHVYEAIERYRKGIRGIMRNKAFIEIKEIPIIDLINNL